jgi:DNA-binding MarR family transcriptional regulator
MDAHGFDPLIHSPLRLRACAALDASVAVEFAALEELLGVSAPTLSKQLKVLVDAGYVGLERRPQHVGRPRTWVSLTPRGRHAYTAHIAALRSIIG